MLVPPVSGAALWGAMGALRLPCGISYSIITHGRLKTVHGKTLILRVTSGGYLEITCTVLEPGCNVRCHNLHVRRELCMAFKEDRRPPRANEVDHIDRNKLKPPPGQPALGDASADDANRTLTVQDKARSSSRVVLSTQWRILYSSHVMTRPARAGAVCALLQGPESSGRAGQRHRYCGEDTPQRRGRGRSARGACVPGLRRIGTGRRPCQRHRWLR